jgi:hypothetical protein
VQNIYIRTGETRKRSDSSKPNRIEVGLFSGQGWIVTGMFAMEKKKTPDVSKTP